MSLSTTLISTSLSVRVASCARSLASMAMFIAWLGHAEQAVEASCAAARGLLTGTTITTSAQVWRATSTGRLRTSMPST